MAVLQGASMIYVRRRDRTICGHQLTEVCLVYDRIPTPPTSLRKTIAAALLTLALTVAFFAAMELTDIPDHRPTTILIP